MYSWCTECNRYGTLLPVSGILYLDTGDGQGTLCAEVGLGALSLANSFCWWLAVSILWLGALLLSCIGGGGVAAGIEGCEYAAGAGVCSLGMGCIGAIIMCGMLKFTSFYGRAFELSSGSPISDVSLAMMSIATLAMSYAIKNANTDSADEPEATEEQAAAAVSLSAQNASAMPFRLLSLAFTMHV